MIACSIVEAPLLHRLMDVCNTTFMQSGIVISLAVLLIDARGTVMVQFLSFVAQTMQESSVSTCMHLCMGYRL